MTLSEVIRAIEIVAKGQPSVNMIVRNDVFRINSAPNVLYGVFAWLQREHRYEVETDTMHYSFTFFYVDRLTEDGSNEVEVQSTGISTLRNILQTLDDADIYVEDDYTFQTFNQRFLDVCAGAYCNVTFSVPSSPCGEEFPDFGSDYNEDFLIF